MDQSNSTVKSTVSSLPSKTQALRPARRRSRNSRGLRSAEKGRSKDGENQSSTQGQNARSKETTNPRSTQGQNARRANATSRGKNRLQKSSQEQFVASVGAGIQRLKPKRVYKCKQNPDRFMVAAPASYTPECNICHKIITDSHSAVSLSNTGLASHFDCVLAYLTKHEKLSSTEHIVYLGAGEFGVVQNKTEKEPLVIIRRIAYEESRHENNAWRRELALTPSFIVRVLKTTDMLKDEESKAFRRERNSKKYQGWHSQQVLGNS